MFAVSHEALRELHCEQSFLFLARDAKTRMYANRDTCIFFTLIFWSCAGFQEQETACSPSMRELIDRRRKILFYVHETEYCVEQQMVKERGKET